MSATRPGAAERLRLQAAEAVGHVDVERLGGVAHRGGRVGLRRQRLEQRLEPPRRVIGQPVALGQPRERFTGNAQDTGRVGVTTSLRSGSSPSLCVSTSVRSRRCTCTTLRSSGRIGSSSTGRP